MKVLFFIDQISEDVREGEAVEYEGKIWLLAPLPGQIEKVSSGPVRLIRLDSLPKFWEHTSGVYILNTPIPTHILFGRDGSETTGEYDVQILQDIAACTKNPKPLH